MDYAWTVYVRDVFIILAAAALILACLYAGLVAWQIYRMASELSVELQPIVDSMEQSASTVESTTTFLSGRFSSPATAAGNTALGLFGLYQLYRQARQQQATAPPAPVEPVVQAPPPVE